MLKAAPAACEILHGKHLVRSHPDMRDPCPQRLEFDAKAEVYESNRLAPWYQAQGERVLGHLSLEPADVVLDVGCGTGYLLRQIARACPGVIGIGVDVAPRMVEVARARAAEQGLSQLTFVAADWEQQSDETMRLISRQAVACAVCVSAFHYFAAPVSALAAIHDVLRPGGRLLILDRARERSLLTVVWQYAHRFVLRDNVHFSSSAEIAGMLEQAGFEDIRVLERLRKVLWKNKLYTSLALIRGTKLGASATGLRSKQR
jgi:ubiquinone/menaquinone biosynthesis C-methylase UbiE